MYSLLYYPHQPEQREGDEVKEDDLEKRKIEGKKDGNNCQDKKGFVVDGRQETLGNQYENNKGE